MLLLTAIPVLAALTGDLQGTIFDPKGLPVSRQRSQLRIWRPALRGRLAPATPASSPHSSWTLELTKYGLEARFQASGNHNRHPQRRSNTPKPLTRSRSRERSGHGRRGLCNYLRCCKLTDKHFDRFQDRFGSPQPGPGSGGVCDFGTRGCAGEQGQPVPGSGSFNANGQRGRGNNITVDNSTATDISTTGSSGTGTFSLTPWKNLS